MLTIHYFQELSSFLNFISHKNNLIFIKKTYLINIFNTKLHIKNTKENIILLSTCGSIYNFAILNTICNHWHDATLEKSRGKNVDSSQHLLLNFIPYEISLVIYRQVASDPAGIVWVLCNELLHQI